MQPQNTAAYGWRMWLANVKGGGYGPCFWLSVELEGPVPDKWQAREELLGQTLVRCG